MYLGAFHALAARRGTVNGTDARTRERGRRVVVAARAFAIGTRCATRNKDGARNGKNLAIQTRVIGIEGQNQWGRFFWSIFIFFFRFCSFRITLSRSSSSSSGDAYSSSRLTTNVVHLSSSVPPPSLRSSAISSHPNRFLMESSRLTTRRALALSTDSLQAFDGDATSMFARRHRTIARRGGARAVGRAFRRRLTDVGARLRSAISGWSASSCACVCARKTNKIETVTSRKTSTRNATPRNVRVTRLLRRPFSGRVRRGRGGAHVNDTRGTAMARRKRRTDETRRRRQDRVGNDAKRERQTSYQVNGYHGYGSAAGVVHSSVARLPSPPPTHQRTWPAAIAPRSRDRPHLHRATLRRRFTRPPRSGACIFRILYRLVVKRIFLVNTLDGKETFLFQIDDCILLAVTVFRNMTVL